MKKISLMLLSTIVLLTIGTVLFAQETKENPFKTIFGIPWGANAQEVEAKFEVEQNRKLFKGSLQTGTNIFTCENFKLGPVTLSKIWFHFKELEGPGFKFKKENYSKFILDQVTFIITPNEYQTIKEILVEKYGKPFRCDENEIQNRMGAKFQQENCIWNDKESVRSVWAMRYASRIDESRIMFVSYDSIEENKEKDKDETEAAAKKF